ncbi:MAG TPA: restriction endonuclease subunit S [Candidatus Acidoferrales bacterium]|nr:restriction endonuclease subunit S [Candidatus Acidoferrales bacterium]
MTEELPQGWAEAELGTLLNLVNGFAFKPSHWGKRGLPIIRIQNLNNPNAPFNYCEDDLPEKVRVRAGDLLFAWSGTPGTSFGAHIWNGGDAWLNQHIFRVGFDSRLFDKSFLRYAINQNLDRYIAQAHGGAGLAHITKGMFEASALKFAPLPEQQRIVAKLEKLLGRVDVCHDRLAKIPILLKRFRQSVLAAACSGKLTEDWRKENPSDETAAGIVEAIRRRRAAKIRTPAQHVKLTEIYDNSEESDSENLPLGWKFVALGKLCESFDYGTSTKSQPTGKVPVLRMGNIQNGKLDWKDLVYTSDKSEIDGYQLKPKTVLFNRTNSPELVGKTAIYLGERPAIFAGHLIRVNQYPELDPEYLNFCLNTSYARAFCQSVKTDGVSQSNINAQKLAQFEVPFCRLAEQQEIVRRMEKLFAIADQIETRFAEAHKRVDSITQSLLAKAFRGELVPTEFELAKAEGHSFESAEELLKRIGRNGEPKKNKTKGSKRRV